MKCFECRQEGREREAVALCRHGLAYLCETHLPSIGDLVAASEPLFKVVVLPLRARRFLCRTFQAALRQAGRAA
jgi:hypothetical protein